MSTISNGVKKWLIALLKANATVTAAGGVWAADDDGLTAAGVYVGLSVSERRNPSHDDVNATITIVAASEQATLNLLAAMRTLFEMTPGQPKVWAVQPTLVTVSRVAVGTVSDPERRGPGATLWEATLPLLVTARLT